MKGQYEIKLDANAFKRERIIQDFIKDIRKALKVMASAYRENAFTYKEYMETLRFISNETTLIFISTKQFCDKYKLQYK